jgi:hypothetical protein
MKGIIFTVFCVSLVSVSFSLQTDDAWRKSVEEILSGIVLGPLSEHFEPSKLGKRSQSLSINAQTTRLRAHVVGHMFRSTKNFVKACPLEDSSTEAIEALIKEFRDRKFDMYWIESKCECNSHDGFIFAPIPFPEAEPGVVRKQ